MCCWGWPSCSAMQGSAGEPGCFKGGHTRAPQPQDVPVCHQRGQGPRQLIRKGESLGCPLGSSPTLQPPSQNPVPVGWGAGEGPQGLVPAPRRGPSSPPQLPADSAGRGSHSFRQVLPGVNGEEVSQAPVINANYRAATWESFLPQVSFQKWLSAGVAPSLACH